LNVEDGLLAADFLHRLLDERRLTDSPTTSYLGEEPAIAAEHPL